MSARRLDALIWVLVYGGLLSVGLGLALRDGAPVLGHTVLVVGAVVVAIGVVLIWVRSRLRDPSTKKEIP